MPVNDGLTSNRPADLGPDRRTRPTKRRRRAPVENTDYAAFALRIIRAHARRISEGDIEGLTELTDLARELDTATRAAIAGLREAGYSWADIAARLGTTRQAAHQRWGR